MSLLTIQVTPDFLKEESYLPAFGNIEGNVDTAGQGSSY
jgi:hypothetical protein